MAAILLFPWPSARSPSPSRPYFFVDDAALGPSTAVKLNHTFSSLLGHVVEGWTSLSTLILVLGSMQLILFGLLGEYVGRLYLESKRRPLFVIDEIRTGESVSTSAPYQISGERRDASGGTPN